MIEDQLFSESRKIFDLFDYEGRTAIEGLTYEEVNCHPLKSIQLNHLRNGIPPYYFMKSNKAKSAFFNKLSSSYLQKLNQPQNISQNHYQEPQNSCRLTPAKGRKKDAKLNKKDKKKIQKTPFLSMNEKKTNCNLSSEQKCFKSPSKKIKRILEETPKPSGVIGNQTPKRVRFLEFEQVKVIDFDQYNTPKKISNLRLQVEVLKDKQPSESQD